MLRDIIHFKMERSIAYNRINTQWTVGLFGTAIGAGILFLPIEAGRIGLVPLLVISLLICPITYISHRGLVRLTLTSSDPEGSITSAVYEHFGKHFGDLFTLIYTLLFLSTLMVYGLALTNIFSNLVLDLTQQPEAPRGLISFITVCTLVGTLAKGYDWMLRAINLFTIPLAITLLSISIYLIPQWQTTYFINALHKEVNYKHLIESLPLFIFTFQFGAACSSLASFYHKSCTDLAICEKTTATIVRRNTILLSFFTLFFVISCMFSLSPKQVQTAFLENLPVLSLFDSSEGTGLFGTLSNFVAITAIMTSFIGTFLGTREGLNSMIYSIMRNKPEAPHQLNHLSELTIGVIVWGVCWANFSIIHIIDSLLSPFLVAVLYLLPTYAVYKIDVLKKYRSLWDIIIVLTALLAIGSVIGAW